MNVPAQMIGPLADAHRRTVAVDLTVSRRSRRSRRAGPSGRRSSLPGAWRSLIGRPTRRHPARRPAVGPTPVLR